MLVSIDTGPEEFECNGTTLYYGNFVWDRMSDRGFVDKQNFQTRFVFYYADNSVKVSVPPMVNIEWTNLSTENMNNMYNAINSKSKQAVSLPNPAAATWNLMKRQRSSDDTVDGGKIKTIHVKKPKSKKSLRKNR